MLCEQRFLTFPRRNGIFDFFMPFHFETFRI